MTQTTRSRVSDELKREFVEILIELANEQSNSQFTFEDRHLLIPFVKALSNAYTKTLFDQIALRLPQVERSYLAKLYHSSIYPFLARYWPAALLARIKVCCEEQATLAVVDGLADERVDREQLFYSAMRYVYGLMEIDRRCDELYYNQKQVRDAVSDNLRKAVDLEMQLAREHDFRFSFGFPGRQQQFLPLEEFLVERNG